MWNRSSFLFLFPPHHLIATSYAPLTMDFSLFKYDFRKCNYQKIIYATHTLFATSFEKTAVPCESYAQTFLLLLQVKVGQAIYRTGSLFNHSCQPNVHAYFLSRMLFIRTTEFIAAGCPLELSYGPQVYQPLRSGPSVSFGNMK